MSAQIGPCSGNAPVGGSIAPSSGGTGGCKVAECDEQIFDFYITSPNANNYAYNWIFLHAIVREVDINGQLKPLNGHNTYIEVAASKQCTPVIAGALTSFELLGDVTFAAGDATNVEPTNQRTLDLTSPLLIMRVVVHAPPGTKLQWETPVETKVIVAQHGAPNFCGTFNVMTPGIVQIPNVANCSNLHYSFNFTGGGTYFAPTPVSVPIMFNTGGIAIQELEALVEVSSTNFMNFSPTTSGMVPAGQIKERRRVDGNIHYQDIYLNTTSGQFTFAGSGVLLNVNISGPFNVSVGASVTVTVKYIRVKTVTGCCILQSLNGSSRSFSYAGYEPCEDFTLTIDDTPNATNDCEVPYKMTLSWPSSLGNSIFFKRLEFSVYFKTPLPSVNLLDNTICPSGDCMQFVNINNGAGSPEGILVSCVVENVTLNNNSYFTAGLSGASGCVTAYTVSVSTIETSQGICVPILNPPYAYDNYARCMARLSGQLFYRFSAAAADCDSYLIDATTNQGGPECDFSETLNDSDFAYSFCVCGGSFPYEVGCQKATQGNYLAGVNALDLAAINLHLLSATNPGLPTLNDGFKLQAADVDCSGSITAEDVRDLRDLLLGNALSLPAPSYKIIPVVPPVDNTFPAFCNTHPVKNVFRPRNQDINFYVVKTGDCTSYFGEQLSCRPSSTVVRSPQTMAVSAMYAKAQAGTNIKIPVLLNGDMDAQAFQAEFLFDVSLLQFKGFSAGAFSDMDERSVGLTRVQEGVIRAVWFSSSGKPVHIAQEAPLFYLEFLVLQSHDVAVLTVNQDAGIPAVVYMEDEGAYLLHSARSTQVISSLSCTISPNPFRETATLRVWNAGTGDLFISIVDATGRQTGTCSVPVEDGQSSVILPAHLFGAGGMHFVNVQTSTGVRTLKVVRE